MNPIQKETLRRIAEYWDEYPSLRFTQVLQNLKINDAKDCVLRDNYYDTDKEVLSRIAESQL